MNAQWTFHGRLRPFYVRFRPIYDQKISETDMKRSGTLNGLKSLQNHGHVHVSKAKELLQHIVGFW